MEELIKQQLELVSKNIIITIFPFKDGSVYKYRAYFRDLNTDYLYNPIMKDGKVNIPIYNSYEEALKEMIIQCNIHLQPPKDGEYFKIVSTEELESKRNKSYNYIL